MLQVKTIVLCLALCTTLFAQPYAPPQQYAYAWQPVAIPGQYYAVQRYTFVGNWLFGPRVIFVPQSPPMYPGPVQPQYQQQPASIPPPRR